MKTLFISRQIKHNGALKRFCVENKIEFIAQSLIDFKPILVSTIPFAEVVFFTSPRSVKFYLEQTKIAKNQLVASVGIKTTQALQQNGIDVHFTGENATQPQAVAVSFKKWLGEKTVLFPQSNISNRTMQQQLDEKQYTDLVVYETILTPQIIQPKPDLLVFSSPSNVEAFLKMNSLDESQLLFAFGTTTANHLKKQGYDSTVLTDISEGDIVAHFEKIL